ncbi:hypothetical protein BDK51DRAFT_43117 [Blyttiomyces helicus]|uniref:Secreted protein n=1 Tax=Blyttiomyces helicus TaxID=388810 RepID=A0A4P9W3B7_9FUNG|nr:hypothetical protein BDK51DRAFT_43117 [Blyttiomyces helicus]|eukprot:RKO86292.1 hypothetical protein BDK51DRAFT_43117 [Blyttiomyces helicus]
MNMNTLFLAASAALLCFLVPSASAGSRTSFGSQTSTLLYVLGSPRLLCICLTRSHLQLQTGASPPRRATTLAIEERRPEREGAGWKPPSTDASLGHIAAYPPSYRVFYAVADHPRL